MKPDVCNRTRIKRGTEIIRTINDAMGQGKEAQISREIKKYNTSTKNLQKDIICQT